MQDKPAQPLDPAADAEMQTMLDRYLPHRRPVSVDDYAWEQVRPETLEPEFLEALGFVTLVESNPSAPGQQILDAADRSQARWLRRFVSQTWLPEEGMHHAPFKEYLIRVGAYQEQFLDAEIDKVVQRGFPHGEGYSDVQAATYGWMQELITWKFYDMLRDHLLSRQTTSQPADRVMVQILADVAKQENFHRHVYLSGVKTALNHSPHRREEVVSAVAEFVMPGHLMAPDWQPKAPMWAEKFKFPLRGLAHDIVHGLVELTGHAGLGQASLQYGTRNKIHWALRLPTSLAGPLSRFYNSPANHVAGRFLARML